jgi:hypothetical protein
VSDTAQRSDLVDKRDRLLERFTAMQLDLGGLFYEMAIRDHVRLEILTGKAAELQRVDAELGQVEQLLRTQPEPVTGSCPQCGTPHARAALFCGTCGGALTPAADAGTT